MINGIGSATTSLLNTALNGARPGEGVGRAGSAKPGQMSASTIMAQMAADGAPVDMDRVSALRAAIKAGTYRADPEAIAARMIRDDLGEVRS